MMGTTYESRNMSRLRLREGDRRLLQDRLYQVQNIREDFGQLVILVLGTGATLLAALDAVLAGLEQFEEFLEELLELFAELF
jgi:hypothetical protein